MKGRLSSLNATVNNVRLTWRQIAKEYIHLDTRVEKKLAEEVRKYRETAMEERRLAEEEAATRTPNAQEQGDAEGPGERARCLEQRLAEGVLTLHLSWRGDHTP